MYTTKVHKLLRSSQASSQFAWNILYNMAASKKPELSKPPFWGGFAFWGGEAAPKVSFAKFGFFEAAILYVFRELLRRGLRTSEKLVYLR